MKKLLSASAAAAALLVAAPAFAGSGHVDLSYTDLDSDVVELTSVNIGGAAVIDLGGAWNVQGEAVSHRVEIDVFGPAGEGNYTDAALRLFHRNDSWAAGVYVDTTDAFMVSAYGLGVEGEKYFDRVTLAGSLGYNTADGGFFFFGGDDVNGWNATAGATVFVTDNLSFGADVVHMDIEDEDMTVWGLEAEFKPDTLPVSFFGGWRSQDESVITGEDSQAWNIGLRWNFGAGSLKDRDRTGASMNGGASLADALF